MGSLKEMTEEQLLALEEYLYDEEVSGVETWAEREKVLAELADRRAERLKDTFK